jgi:hypothetical protein
MPEQFSRVERLRRAVAAAVARESLRGVAREVGLSAPAVQNFIDGAEPRRASTLRKLEGWYVRERSREAEPADGEAALAAVEILTRDLPAGRRRDVGLGLLTWLEAQFQQEVELTPAWLDDVRQRIESEPEGH